MWRGQLEALDRVHQARRLGMFAALKKAVERLAKERPLRFWAYQIGVWAPDDGDALRPQVLLDRVGDLVRQAFLNLQSSGENFGDPRELRQSDDAPALRNVCDMTFADKRREMMFAGRREGDRAKQDRLLVALSLGEGSCQQ